MFPNETSIKNHDPEHAGSRRLLWLGAFVDPDKRGPPRSMENKQTAATLAKVRVSVTGRMFARKMARCWVGGSGTGRVAALTAGLSQLARRSRRASRCSRARPGIGKTPARQRAGDDRRRARRADRLGTVLGSGRCTGVLAVAGSARRASPRRRGFPTGRTSPRPILRRPRFALFRDVGAQLARGRRERTDRDRARGSARRRSIRACCCSNFLAAAGPDRAGSRFVGSYRDLRGQHASGESRTCWRAVGRANTHRARHSGDCGWKTSRWWCARASRMPIRR